MILKCPACSTRYLVSDDAIGVDGRQVRCASCKHSWFQEGAEIMPAPVPSPPVSPPPAQHEFAMPERAEPAGEPGSIGAPIAPGWSDEPDPFDHAPPFRPRRNPARLWTAIAVGIFVLLGAIIAALAIWGPPDMASRLGFSGASAESALDVQLVSPPERRTLASGHELLSITGRIVNLSDDRQPVPDIRAELRNAQGAVVYDWTIQAPQRMLPAREMVEFNSAEIDIPRNAEELNLKFAPRDGG